jgi:protein SCO1/2
MRKYWLISLLGGILACSQSSNSKIPYYNTPDFTPLFLHKNEASKQITHRIKPFVFINQDSTIFDSKSLQGKVYVANFIFTRCSNICPDMTTQMKRIEKAFHTNSQVVLLSFSVTPWLDDVKTLNKFATKYQISSKNWSLLTGSKEAIYSLARKSYFAEESIGFNKDSKEFLHTEHIILVDQQGRIRGIYNGTLPLDAEQCILDMLELLQE